VESWLAEKSIDKGGPLSLEKGAAKLQQSSSTPRQIFYEGRLPFRGIVDEARRLGTSTAEEKKSFRKVAIKEKKKNEDIDEKSSS